MRPGATIMSSFLFNIALILIATTASIQFCATAFAQYADGTEILNIFGNQACLGWAAGGREATAMPAVPPRALPFALRTSPLRRQLPKFARALRS